MFDVEDLRAVDIRPMRFPYRVSAATLAAVALAGASTSQAIGDQPPDRPCDGSSAPPATIAVNPEDAQSTSEAVDAVRIALPDAIEPATEASHVDVDPSLSVGDDTLTSTGSLADLSVSRDPSDGFSLGSGNGAICLTPVRIGSEATDGKVVNGDAIVFANTDREASTVVRPTAAGAETFTVIDGASAPTQFSWRVELGEGQQIETLPDGTVAIVIPAPSVGPDASLEVFDAGEYAPISDAATSDPGPSTVGDADSELIQAQNSFRHAQEQTKDQVVYVFANPWAIDADGNRVQTSLAAHDGTVTMSVPHTESDAYPIVADPDVVASAATAGGPLRTMTFNIRGGTPRGGNSGPGGTSADYYYHAARVAAEISAALDKSDSQGRVPGVAALQEVCGSDAYWIASWLAAYSGASVWTGEFQQTTTSSNCPSEHAFGNATFRNVGLYDHTFVSYANNSSAKEPRGYIRDELNVRNRAVMTFNTHLDASSAKVGEITQLANANSNVSSYPRITMGDFNIRYGSTEQQEYLKFFYTSPYHETDSDANTWTYSANGDHTSNTGKLDYTFYAGSRLSLNGASVHDVAQDTSDHRTLVSSFNVSG